MSISANTAVPKDMRTKLIIRMSDILSSNPIKTIIGIVYLMTALVAWNQYFVSIFLNSDLLGPLYQNQELESIAATLKNHKVLATFFAACISVACLSAPTAIERALSTKSHDFKGWPFSLLLLSTFAAGFISMLIGLGFKVSGPLGIGWPTYWLSQGFLLLLVVSVTALFSRNNFNNLTREWFLITASVTLLPLAVIIGTYAFSTIFGWSLKDAIISGCEISFVMVLVPPFLLMAYNKQTQL